MSAIGLVSYEQLGDSRIVGKYPNRLILSFDLNSGRVVTSRLVYVMVNNSIKIVDGALFCPINHILLHVQISNRKSYQVLYFIKVTPIKVESFQMQDHYVR